MKAAEMDNLLRRIAFRLEGESYNDLTTAERLITDLLSENEFVELKGEFQKVTRMDKNSQKKARAKLVRKAREEAMKSVGMVKVKGNLGGTYWE